MSDAPSDVFVFGVNFFPETFFLPVPIFRTSTSRTHRLPRRAPRGGGGGGGGDGRRRAAGRGRVARRAGVVRGQPSAKRSRRGSQTRRDGRHETSRHESRRPVERHRLSRASRGTHGGPATTAAETVPPRGDVSTRRGFVGARGADVVWPVRVCFRFRRLFLEKLTVDFKNRNRIFNYSLKQ